MIQNSTNPLQIIVKTPGKRYVYKFVCNLDALLGCDAQRYFQLCGIEPQADKSD